MRLIGYLSSGYPSKKAVRDIASLYWQVGCSSVIYALPSRRPYLESRPEAERMLQGLERYASYAWHLEESVEIRMRLPGCGLLLLVYEDTVKEIGADEFCDFCTASGNRELIYLGPEDSYTRDYLIHRGLRLSERLQFFLPSAAPKEEGPAIVCIRSGWDGAPAEPEDLRASVQLMRRRYQGSEILCGLPIRRREDCRIAEAAGADGAILDLCAEPEQAMRSFWLSE